MSDAQELFRLLNEAQRLWNGLHTAGSFDADFKAKVKAMLAGEGPPVTPDEAAKFTELIKHAEGQEADQQRMLAQSLAAIGSLLARHFSDGA